MAKPIARPSRVSLLLLGAILGSTAIISLAWSHHKLLNQDEIFVLQTDSVPTASQVLHIQLHSPIALDPPVYHLLVHAALSILGVTPFALRLPSLLGFLLMQVCLFIYVSRTAGDRAGLLGAAIPAVTATLFYSAEARPYGLLLGLFALALVAYQAATRAWDKLGSQQCPSHSAALCTLALAIALALNSHYFAILLLPPLYAAELVRTVVRRKLDIPVAIAILAGTACFGFTIPFQQAASVFRIHYYNLANVSGHAITQAYRALLVDYTQTSLHMQHLIAIVFVLCALCFLAALALRWKELPLRPGELAFLLTLAALPFFGYLLARFVTHSIEVRYVLGAIIAIAALSSILLEPILSHVSNLAFTVIVAIVIAAAGVLHVCTEARKSAETLASLRLPASLDEALRADPSGRIYIQEVGRFEEARYNTPDAELRDRLALVYSSDREIRIDGHDTEALTAEHLAQFSSLPIVSYDQLMADRSPHIVFLNSSNGWQWIDRALTEDDVATKPIALWFGGQAVLAVSPAAPMQ